MQRVCSMAYAQFYVHPRELQIGAMKAYLFCIYHVLTVIWNLCYLSCNLFIITTQKAPKLRNIWLKIYLKMANKIGWR